jgi:tripartite-type tricarboxylate transporter receptor subunit TctC
MFLQYAVAKPHISSGKLNMLATPSGKRSPAIPDVPTISESGLAGFDVEPWFGIVAPIGTPPAVIARLNAEISKIMQQSDVREMLAGVGATPSVSTPQEFAKFIDYEVTRWGEVVKTSGAKAE